MIANGDFLEMDMTMSWVLSGRYAFDFTVNEGCWYCRYISRAHLEGCRNGDGVGCTVNPAGSPVRGHISSMRRNADRRIGPLVFRSRGTLAAMQS